MTAGRARGEDGEAGAGFARPPGRSRTTQGRALASATCLTQPLPTEAARGDEDPAGQNQRPTHTYVCLSLGQDPVPLWAADGAATARTWVPCWPWGRELARPGDRRDGPSARDSIKSTSPRAPSAAEPRCKVQGEASSFCTREGCKALGGLEGRRKETGLQALLLGGAGGRPRGAGRGKQAGRVRFLFSGLQCTPPAAFPTKPSVKYSVCL